MASHNSLKIIADLLQEEHGLCQQLLQALNAEFDALKQRDADLFNQVLTKKQAATAQLEQNETALFEILQVEGFSQSKDGLETFFSSLDDKSDQFGILHTWNELRKLIVECQNQNQINGRILNISLVNIQQALNLLNGRDANPGLYNDTGKSDDSDSNQSLAIA
jgi:flagellar biosynthesis/type III secretory pathway chaperone